ncbi:MAG: AMP-binding protein, partial [Bacteroidaceae bacterium]|nr:AMP-binding protein [Bacteroidaceae bacterium]
KPKLIITVPLVIEKVIKQKIQPVMEKPMMKILMAIPGINRIIGGKIRNKIIDAFGGEMDSLIVGGAALNADVEKILRKIHFPYTVGYGSTECAPLISYVDWEKYKAGSCGIAIPGCPVEVFSDAPGNVGELLVKGDNVMLGYYKNPNATRDVIDPEGWFHTGDLGTIDKQGYIYIKGRSKNMILGPSGQNIYPEEIEDMYMNLPMVSEVLVVERDRKLVALVFPDYDAGKSAGLNQQQVLAHLEEDRKKINEMLPGYSQVAKLEIRTEEFEKTPKRSIRRGLYK